MKKEIERKFAIKYLPKDIKIEKVEEIEQAYLYEDANTNIRIRKRKVKDAIQYIYTVKTKDDTKREIQQLRS